MRRVITAGTCPRQIVLLPHQRGRCSRTPHLSAVTELLHEHRTRCTQAPVRCAFRIGLGRSIQSRSCWHQLRDQHGRTSRKQGRSFLGFVQRRRRRTFRRSCTKSSAAGSIRSMSDQGRNMPLSRRKSGHSGAHSNGPDPRERRVDVTNFCGQGVGAGEGNRTLVFSLEGCCSTIELHPRREAPGHKTAGTRRMVGEVGLEPTKA